LSSIKGGRTVTDEPFGRRLRRERERRQIALASISANTKISVALFEALEREDVSRWPTGIFRRAFIRAYATGIGLDPDIVVQEFLERFPDPTEALPTVPPDPRASSSARESARSTVLRLTLADTGGAFKRGRVLGDMGRRWAAVACDAAVLMAVAVGVFVACGRFWLPLGVSTLGYYWGAIVLLGNTPGVCLWAPATHSDDSQSTGNGARAKLLKARAAFLRFKGAASTSDQRATLRSEPRGSGS
jgi:transcriptional regulator with XRE-family HTH domain